MKKPLAVFLSCMLLVGTMQIASAAESVPMSPLDGLKYLTEEASADAVVKVKPVKAPVKNAPAKAPAGTPGVEDEEGTGNPLADPGDSGSTPPAATLQNSGSITVTGLKEGTTVNAYRLVKLETNASNTHFYNQLNSPKYQPVFDELGVENVSSFAEKPGSAVLAAAQKCITAAATVPAAEYSQTVQADQNSLTITGADLGFYYIAMTAAEGDFTIYNPMLVLVPQVSETPGEENVTYAYDVNAAAKSSSPGIEKKILEGTQLVNTTSASIGDIIKYQLTTLVPEYKADIDDEKVVFKITDTMSKGLTYKDGFAVYGIGEAGGAGTTIENPLTGGFATPTVTVKDETGETSIVMDFDYTKIKEYKSIRITYDAGLNEDAVIGGAGNPNEAKLAYSHDTSKVDDSGKYPSKEPPGDKTVVYTFGLDITKYELGDMSVKLSGAEFSMKTAGGQQVYFKSKDAENIIYTAIVADAQPENTRETITTIAGGKLIIEGLGEGSYTLTEVKAPNDYHIIDKSIPITITAEKTGEELTGKVTQDTGISAGSYGDAYYVKNIANSPKYALPQTGGIGTAIFGLIAVLAAAAACVMLYRRRNE